MTNPLRHNPTLKAMELKDAVKALVALGHASRLQAYRLLVQQGPEGLSAGELARLTRQSPSALSFHLKELVNANLLDARHDGRFIFYSARYRCMTALLDYLTENCCNGAACMPARSQSCPDPDSLQPKSEPMMTEKVYNVLFLCTHNSSRSIMAEALLNTMGKGRFKAYSAGSTPGTGVNPFALEKVKTMGYDTSTLRSKNWDEFAAPDAPQMDFIITVCDNAAGEVCPVWPGQPISAHWSFEDPAAATGTDEQKRAVFDKIYRQISTRISLFANMPLDKIEKAAIHRELKVIGNTPV